MTSDEEKGEYQTSKSRYRLSTIRLLDECKQMQRIGTWILRGKKLKGGLKSVLAFS